MPSPTEPDPTEPDAIDWRARIDAASAGEAAVPPPERHLTEIEKAAFLANWRCPHCDAKQVPIAASDAGVRATDVFHEPGCPDYVPA